MTPETALTPASGNAMLARIRTRPIAVCLHGPSLSRMSDTIEALHDIGAVFCSVNDIGVVEKHTAAVGRRVDAWFCFAESEFTRLNATVPGFLEREEPNLLVTFSTTLARLDAPLALTLAQRPELTNRILLADSMAARVFGTCLHRPINSLTGLLSALTLLEARGPVFLLGCDGVRADQTAFDAYDQPEKLAPHRLGSWCTLHRDMTAFHENWPLLAAHFANDLGLPLPEIVNCNPDSHYTAFPKMRWQDALATSRSSCFSPARAAGSDERTALTPLDEQQEWPVRDVAALASALDAFRQEITRAHEWIQRDALEPYLGWHLAEWPPHVIGLHPEAPPLDVSTASWSTLDTLRSQGVCAIAADVPALKVQIADLAVRALESDNRAVQDSRRELQGQLEAAGQAIADREAAVATHAERTRHVAGALARARLAHLAAEYRLNRLRVAVCPAGGHTRELLSTTALSEIPIVGVVDSSPACWGTAFLGHHVSSPDALERLRPDVVVICSQSFENEIYEQLAWLRSRGTATVRLYTPDTDLELPARSDTPPRNRVA